ncbi:MAG: hypothetical protein P1U56_25355 [Saprospiraceae bacterium]|nr:hypothetical protein [Saprospiraceae bacterium]
MDSWKLKQFGVFMDGGSLLLEFEDSLGTTHSLNFVQAVILEYYEEINNYIPGRIYLNKRLIEKRSNEEAFILDAIKKYLLDSFNSDEKELILEKIAFVESNRYLELQPIKKELSAKRKAYLIAQQKKSKFDKS